MALWTAILREDLTSMVTWAGVSDVVFTYKEREDMRRMMKRVIGGAPNNMPDAYRERTALFRVHDIEIPTLIIHGTADTNVSFEQALLLENALRDANKEYETWYLEGFTHYIPPEMNRKLVKEAVDWMKSKSR